VEHTSAEIVAYVFLDLAVIVVVARLMGRLAVRLGQPAVIGEIIAGILLGPTLLGALPGDLVERLFPGDVRPFLNVLAQLGLVLFMFIVGLEVDLSFIRGREKLAFSVSSASIALPFGLGVLLAHQLYDRHDDVGGSHVEFIAFALFLGVAMSITAFPVLARILSERGMHRVPTGVLSLACAAVDDVFAWALLAVVVAVTVGGSATGVLQILLWTVIFALVMFLVVRRLLTRLLAAFTRADRLTPEMLALVLVGVLVSAWVTEEIGIHFIFGAFVFGVVMPRAGAAQLTHEITEHIEQLSVLLLLPVFFVVTGLGVDVGGVGLTGLGELGLILLVAISGKFLGAFGAARALRVPRRQSTTLGVLMNTRGLTELVILNLGVQLGVLDGEMFTLLVIMAVVTTVMTSPLLRVVYPPRVLQRDIVAAERAALGLVEAYTVLVVVDDTRDGVALTGLAGDLVGRESPAQLVLLRMIPRPRPLEVGSGLGAELGLIAAAGDELRRLSPVAEARGLAVSVAARFSDDPWTDVAEQAGTVQADLVLVRAGWAGERPADAGWPAELAATVVVLSGELDARQDDATDRSVTAALEPTDDGRAALRLAAQLAVGRTGTLQLESGAGWRASRRVGAVAESLRRRGVPVQVTADDAEPGSSAALQVRPAGDRLPDPDPDGRPTLWVHAGTADSDRDLDETLAAIDGTEAPQAR
jgi:Kef-type K+ transport system membrane component KefB